MKPKPNDGRTEHAERIKPKPERDRLLELWVILATLGILEGVK